MSGKLVVLEGMDASGKRTQAERLTKALGARLFSFPDYRGPSGTAVKQLLTASWHMRTSGLASDPQAYAQAFAIQAFHAVSRYEHAAEIQETLDSGQHVVCDRYYASGLVYGQADGLSIDWLWNIHHSLPQPDCSILIDIPPEESVRRRPERRDEYERRAGFMAKVRDGYLSLFAERAFIGPGRWYVVDGTGSEDQVTARIIERTGRRAADVIGKGTNSERDSRAAVDIVRENSEWEE